VTDLDPGSTVDVQLERIKSRQLDVHSQVLDALPIGYDAKPPVVTPGQVMVSGPEILVDQVYEVVADVYLLGSKVTLERDVTVLARDAQGELVQGVTITPATVNANVQVEQRVGYKDVSIRTVLKGAPAAGYWVSNITVTPSSATVVGGPDALAKVAGFVETVPIDVTGATLDVSRPAGLSLPQGVSILNNEGIVVQVSVTPILGGQTVRRKVVSQGLARGLNASVSPDSADVILSGPLPALQALAPDAVQVVVDASGLSAGTYNVKPRILSLPQSLNVQSVLPETIQVIISGSAVTSTITTTNTVTVPSPTPGPTPTPGE
jgi:YbbR domain-containing protein